MIRQESMLNVADNTGGKKIKCIRVLGSGNPQFAGVGDIIIASVKEAAPGGVVKKRGRSQGSDCQNKRYDIAS